MAKQVPADIRLHQNAEGMAPIADDIGQQRPQGKRREHHHHDSEEGLIGALRQ